MCCGYRTSSIALHVEERDTKKRDLAGFLGEIPTPYLANDEGWT